MSTLFADVNDSEDPFAEQKSTQEPKEEHNISDATLDYLDGTTQHSASNATPKPDQNLLVTKEGAQVDEDELLYSVELTYEQRKELRLKKRNMKATEEPKPSKPPKPSHLTKEALQKANPSPRLAPKKHLEDKRSSPISPSKFASHKKDQEKTAAHSTTTARPADGNKAGHTHLKHQNKKLSEELSKLQDEARRLEKKLKEKDHKICELKAEILSLEDNNSETDDKMSEDNSGTEEQQRRDGGDSIQSTDHHGNDSGNDSKGSTTPELDHHGDRHDIRSPDDNVKHDANHQGNHGNHEHAHNSDHSGSSSGRHGRLKAAGHSTSQEAIMSNPWKASKKSHMV